MIKSSSTLAVLDRRKGQKIIKVWMSNDKLNLMDKKYFFSNNWFNNLQTVIEAVWSLKKKQKNIYFWTYLWYRVKYVDDITSWLEFKQSVWAETTCMINRKRRVKTGSGWIFPPTTLLLLVNTELNTPCSWLYSHFLLTLCMIRLKVKWLTANTEFYEDLSALCLICHESCCTHWELQSTRLMNCALEVDLNKTKHAIISADVSEDQTSNGLYPSLMTLLFTEAF